jgi:AcrR family transcriptional regulator
LAEESPGNVRQRQAAATRQQLLMAACDVFEERGYQATSVGAITDRAATAHGTFYLYFKNKEDAFCQVMQAVIIGDLANAIHANPDVGPRERIEQTIRSFFVAYGPHTGLWRAVLEGALQSDRVQEIWLDLRRQIIHRLAESIETECTQGTMRPLDPLMTAHALAAMNEWFAFTHFAMGEPPGGDLDPDNQHAVGVLVDLWYHALYGQVPAELEAANANSEPAHSGQGNGADDAPAPTTSPSSRH